MSKVKLKLPSFDSRMRRAEKFALAYEAPRVAYESWHRGYDAAIRDVRKRLKARKP